MNNVCISMAIFLLAISHVCGQTDDFRIDTDVFLGDAKEPFAQSVTIFTAGLVYDFPLIGPKEITVFDASRGRFVLLDSDRQVKTTLSTQDLLEFTAAMKVHANKMGGVFAEAAGTQFERKVQDDDDKIMLSTGLLTYRVKGVEPKWEAASRSFQEFADWYARLNATRPGSLPPFARIEVNRTLASQGLIPEEVELTVMPQNRLLGRRLVIRSRHLPYWRLSNTDRKRIDTAGTYMAKFDAVSFREYGLANQVADKRRSERDTD
jgi:hypothetical protein